MLPEPLHQQLYLLAHDDQGNALIQPPSLGLGLAGAIVLDLLLADRLVVHEGVVWVRGDQATRDPLTTSVLQAIDQLDKPRSLLFWVREVSTDAYDRVSGRLISSGVLTRTTRRRLGGRKDYLVPSDPVVKARIRSRVLHLVHGRLAGEPVTAVLCGLLGSLCLERALDSVEGTTAEVRRTLRQLAEQRVPASGAVLDLVAELLGEATVAVNR